MLPEWGCVTWSGCSSLSSRNPAEGWQLYRQLEPYRVSSEFATEPTAEYHVSQ